MGECPQERIAMSLKTLWILVLVVIAYMTGLDKGRQMGYKKCADEAIKAGVATWKGKPLQPISKFTRRTNALSLVFEEDSKPTAWHSSPGFGHSSPKE